MIDFRYHLVSLISVFLALAVGVVLGAGPLQNSLGRALNDQVTSLRADRNEIQDQLEFTEAAVNERDAYIEASKAALLPGILDGRSVALVVLPGAAGEDLDSLTGNLETAGATVVGRVNLTTVWTDTELETYRSTFSGSFAKSLGDSAGSDASTILGQGLATAVAGQDPNASELMSLLTTSDKPLATVDAPLSGPADMILVVGPRSVDTTTAEATQAATPVSDPSTWAPVLTGTASVKTTVVLGAAKTEGDLVATLRAAEASVTTVDSVGQPSAALSAVLALPVAAAGEPGSYGFDEGADAVMPSVER